MPFAVGPISTIAELVHSNFLLAILLFKCTVCFINATTSNLLNRFSSLITTSSSKFTTTTILLLTNIL